MSGSANSYRAGSEVNWEPSAKQLLRKCSKIVSTYSRHYPRERGVLAYYAEILEMMAPKKDEAGN